MRLCYAMLAPLMSFELCNDFGLLATLKYYFYHFLNMLYSQMLHFFI